jgi:hypothetical protein
VQVGAVKICVAAVEALRKNKKKDETQVFLESHPCMSKLRVLVPAFSLLYWALDPTFGSFTSLEPVCL